MSPTSAAQLAFAAEFALFVVALGGFASALRHDLLSEWPWARFAAACGFLALATASLLRGALVVTDPRRSLLVGLRGAGVLLVALAAWRWTVRGRGCAAMWLGLAALVAATAAAVTRHVPVADAGGLAAAALLAAGLVSAARRSVSARIGANAAAILLVVVLGVSLTVSVVVSRNVEDEALRRYSARASNEAAAIGASARESLTPAKLVAGSIVDARAVQLVAFVDRVTPAGRAEARASLTKALADLTDDALLAIHDPVLYVGPTGAPDAAVPSNLDNATRLALAGDRIVAEARRSRAPRQALGVVRGKAYALGVVPTFVRRSGRPVQFAGVIVVARRLDDTYLRGLGRAGEPLSFALATPSSVVASAGRQPSAGAVTRAARRAVASVGTVVSSHGRGRFLVAAPVAVRGRPTALSFVVSLPSSAVDATRTSLFRNLFGVSLGAALLALVLAAAAGERIGLGLRRLTRAAERMRVGDFDAPVDVPPGDELGVLGASFTTMAGSIRTMTSELRRSAAEETRLRARMEAVVAGMGEALIAVDAQGDVVELNRAAEDLVGTPRSDALGRPLGDVVKVADGAGVGGARPFDLDDRIGRPPGDRIIEIDLVRADGTAVPVAVTVGQLGGPSGESAGTVLVARDMTREREVESMKTDFLSNISHELRTPLTPIKGYASVLARRPVSPEQAKEFAAQITAGVDQVERVVAQLVNFATMAAGRLTLNVEAVPAAALLDAASARWGPRLDDRHELSVRVKADLGPLRIDRTYLDHVLDELVDNAIKYSPDGGAVRLTAALVDGPMVAISVIDEGIGIDPDRLDGLLQDFAQGDSSSTRRFGGLGLGLALVERIVRAHAGRLDFSSRVGQGTTVSILLPVHAPGRGDDVEPSEPEQAS